MAGPEERRPSKAAREVAPKSSNQVPVAVQPAQVPAHSIVEFSTCSREDPNEGVEFGDGPVECKCLHCDKAVTTFITYEASWSSFALGFTVWFALGWMAFWVLPVLWPAFKDVVHHCPRCLNVISRKSRLKLPTFKTEVMTCKVGGCAVVLARKYLLILGMCVATILGVYLMRSTIRLNLAHEAVKGPPSRLTWEDFLSDCGPRVYLSGRGVYASRRFEERFRQRSFRWHGEVALIREGFDLLWLQTKSVLMVRMDPPRYPGRRLLSPDIALLFGEERYSEVARVSPGDWVEFEATMGAHGLRGDPEVMSLWHIAVVPRSTASSGSLTPAAGGANAKALGDASGDGRDNPGRLEESALESLAALAGDEAAAAAALPGG